MPIHRAIRRVAECIGESDPGGFGERFPRAREAIRVAALAGDLAIRGRKQVLERWSSTLFSESPRPIPPEYWKTHVITAVAAGEGTTDQASAHTALNPAPRRPAGNSYSGLELDGSEVERLWPLPRPAQDAGLDNPD